jgi:hypothetical protein
MQPSSSNQGVYRRGRSSSMLSNVSGFTQSSGEGGFSKWVVEDKSEFAERKDSSGSGSSSGPASGNGSVRDPKSPVRNGNGKGKMAVGNPNPWGIPSVIWDEK